MGCLDPLGCALVPRERVTPPLSPSPRAPLELGLLMGRRPATPQITPRGTAAAAARRWRQVMHLLTAAAQLCVFYGGAADHAWWRGRACPVPGSGG